MMVHSARYIFVSILVASFCLAMPTVYAEPAGDDGEGTTEHRPKKEDGWEYKGEEFERIELDEDFEYQGEEFENRVEPREDWEYRGEEFDHPPRPELPPTQWRGDIELSPYVGGLFFSRDLELSATVTGGLQVGVNFGEDNGLGLLLTYGYAESDLKRPVLPLLKTDKTPGYVHQGRLDLVMRFGSIGEHGFPWISLGGGTFYFADFDDERDEVAPATSLGTGIDVAVAENAHVHLAVYGHAVYTRLGKDYNSFSVVLEVSSGFRLSF